MPGNAQQASHGDYQLLGLPYGAPPDTVKKAYKTFVKAWHPDRFPQGSRQQGRAEDRLKEVNAAYRRIRNGWETKLTESKPETTPPSEERRQGPVGSQIGASSPVPAFPWQRVRERVRSLLTTFSVARAWPVLLLLLLVLLAVLIELQPSPPPKSPTEPFRSQNLDSPLPFGPVSLPPQAPPAAIPSEPPTQVLQPSAKMPDAQPPAPASEPHSPDKAFFTLGSSKAEVQRVQGKPGKVYGQKWVYGLSDVTFRDGRVWRYHNFDGGLKVKLSPSLPMGSGQTAEAFALGATRDEVLRVQGTPTLVDGNKWSYGFSEVHFKDGMVTGFNNFFNNLRVTMQPSRGFEAALLKGYFTIGSSQDEVIALQGTPTIVQGNLWSYQHSDILFVDGKVRSVTDFSGTLKYSRPDSIAEK